MTLWSKWTLRYPRNARAKEELPNFALRPHRSKLWHRCKQSWISGSSQTFHGVRDQMGIAVRTQGSRPALSADTSWGRGCLPWLWPHWQRVTDTCLFFGSRYLNQQCYEKKTSPSPPPKKKYYSSLHQKVRCFLQVVPHSDNITAAAVPFTLFTAPSLPFSRVHSLFRTLRTTKAKTTNMIEKTGWQTWRREDEGRVDQWVERNWRRKRKSKEA